MEHPPGVALETLLRTLAQNTRVIGSRDKHVSAIIIDSREARAGCLFVALRGERTDGHRFIGDAVAAGASSVVMEELCAVPPDVTAVVVPDSARALSQLADTFYGSPSRDLTIAGITGTNGKTTAVHMTAAIMNAAGISSGTIGTVGAAAAVRSRARLRVQRGRRAGAALGRRSAFAQNGAHVRVYRSCGLAAASVGRSARRECLHARRPSLRGSHSRAFQRFKRFVRDRNRAHAGR